MERAQIGKVLSRQLELLAEHSEKCDNDPDLCRLTTAMVEIVRLADDGLLPLN